MLYRLTFDNVAFSKAAAIWDPIELEAEIDDIEAFNQARAGDATWPAAVLAVTKVTANPDNSVYSHGRRDGVVKLFASVEVLVDAESEGAAAALTLNNDWLSKAVALMGHELDLEETWDLLDYELASPQDDSVALEP